MSRRLRSPLPPFDLVPPAVVHAAKRLFDPVEQAADARAASGPGRTDPGPT